jgi:hypothetical protein
MMAKLGIALLGFCALAAVGFFIARSNGELSESQRTRLEEDWEELLTWAGNANSGTTQGPNLEQCAQAWSAARKAHEEATPELARLRALLASGEYSLEGEPYAGVETMQLGRLELESEGLDSVGLGRILTLARRLHHEGPLISFMVGVSLTNQALERCRSNADLIPTDLDLTSPQPGEFFSAVCREFSMMPATLNPSEGNVEDSLRSHVHDAYFAIAKRYLPLRDQPERFGEVPPPERPGWLFNLRAMLLPRPDDMRRVLEPLLTVDMESYGNTWARLVSDWDAVLKP